MVAPIDNLSELAGVLRARRPHPALAGYELVRLDVESTRAVDARADLLASREGESVEVAVPSDVVGSAAEGDRVVCRARLSPRGIVVVAHPRAPAFRATRG